MLLSDSEVFRWTYGPRYLIIMGQHFSAVLMVNVLAGEFVVAAAWVSVVA